MRISNNMLDKIMDELIHWEHDKGFVLHPLVVSKAYHDERVKECLFNIVDCLVEKYRETDPNIVHSAALLKKVFSNASLRR